MNGKFLGNLNVQTGIIFIAAVISLVFGVGSFSSAFRDSGGFAYFLVGVPILCSLLSLLAAVKTSGTTRTLVLVVAAVVALFWGLLLGLGSGFWIIVPGFLLMLSAALQPFLNSRPSPLNGEP